MSWKEKIRAQAAELAEKAQAGVAQGQAKVSEIQAKRRADALLRDLGAAVYAEHHGADRSGERQRLISQLEAHAAEHGPIATEPEADAPTAYPPPTAPAATDVRDRTVDITEPDSSAHTVTGVAEEMPGPAGDSTR
jgi:hypothetical protein